MVKVAVIGAGIAGTSTAYRLLLQNPDCDVTIFAKSFSPNTTSDGAAGFWTPFKAGDTNLELIKKWSKETFDYVMDIITTDGSSSSMGLFTCHGYFLSMDEEFQLPFWADIPSDLKVATKSELKRFPDYVKSGISYTTIVIEGRRIIPYYMKKIKEFGGNIVQKDIKCLDELAMDHDVIVNCSGLASRDLVNDKNMVPIRGQIIKVRAPWVKEFITYDHPKEPCYILPNQEFVVIGGTAQCNNENNKVSIIDRKKILEGTKLLLPSLEKAEVISDWVGFRPSRKGGFRIEKENFVSKKNNLIKVVHNYGHGGSGLTVHWGCAGTAVQLVLKAIDELPTKSIL